MVFKRCGGIETDWTEEQREQTKKDVALLGKILPWAEGAIEEVEKVRDALQELFHSKWLEVRGERLEKEKLLREIETEMVLRSGKFRGEGLEVRG